MLDEVWFPIAEFPQYEVSSYGQIRNTNTDRILRQSRTTQGALKVGLWDGYQQQTRSVKVLVAEAFVRGYSDRFDTPIHLDGDQDNVVADNLAWRPRWFAWKYSKQFPAIYQYAGIGPLVERKSGVVYEDIVEACIKNGILHRELLISLTNKTPIFPNWLIFDRI